MHNLSTVIKLAAVPVIALIFSACKAQDKGLVKKMGTGQELLYLSREGCLGSCPSYEVSYFPKGQVIYKGNHHVPLRGTHLFVVNEKVATALLTEAKKARLNRVKDKWAEAADYPKTTLKLVVEKKPKNFEFWADAPKELMDFSTLVHEQVMKMLAEQPPAKTIEKPGPDPRAPQPETQE